MLNLGIDFTSLPQYNLGKRANVEICLTILIYYLILKSERMFVYFNNGRGL
jgi:hypothetical protein